MTETLSLRAKIEQSPMGAYQWMIVVMAAIMNLLDGFDVLALAFTATAIRGEFGLTGIELGYLLSAGLFGMTAGSLFLAPLADKIGRRKWLIWTTVSILIFALCMPLFLGNGTPTSVFAFLVIGMALMGMTFGPMAALLPELFPTEVRYSGASLAYNIASIIGATIAAMISLKINALYGLMGVGIYLAINAFLTLLALLASKETKNVDLTQI